MGLHMNANYVIVDNVDIIDVGIALGRSLEYPENWVTWMYNQRDADKRNYFWGHYTSNTVKAKIKFQERVMRVAGSELEVNSDKPVIRAIFYTAKVKLNQLQTYKNDPLFPFACKIALWKCRMDKAYFQRDLEETVWASLAEPDFLKNEYQFFQDLASRIPGFLGEELQAITTRLYDFMWDTNGYPVKKFIENYPPLKPVGQEQSPKIQKKHQAEPER